jgi:hypothetical protein
MIKSLRLEKPDIAGLATSVALAVIASQVTPAASLDFTWQVAGVLSVPAINFAFWKKEIIPPMSALAASKQALVIIMVIAAIAGLDIVFGFLFGAQGVSDAFFKSGPAGAPVDLFLLAGFVLVVVPSLVRAVYIHEQSVDK